MSNFILRNGVYYNAGAQDFELTLYEKHEWSEVKIWQMAHKLEVGARFFTYPPASITGYVEIWKVTRVVKHGVVTELTNGSPHQSLREWLSSCWVSGKHPMDFSARTYENAAEWAFIIKKLHT